MQRGLVFAAVTALAVARPELYKEKEDFQYSRSSSDEGTKAGYYGAQRGNMGGNYERAHNMDKLAQHQMGGLINSVHGELGDGANQKSGSVFTAANSRGIYGSGHYDLSNLEGRNFQEGTALDDSQSQSYTASHNSDYRGQAYSSANKATYGSHSQSSHSRDSGFNEHNAVDSTDQLYDNNMQALQSLQRTKQYDAHHTAAENSGYSSQSGYHDSSSYGQAAAGSRYSNGYGSQIRLVNPAPAKVYVRPGGKVSIPVSAQTYDSSQGYSSSVDQNSINTDVGSSNDDTKQTAYQPGNAKNYQSSYKYRKEWERHSTNPVVHTANSELQETQTQGYEHESSGLQAEAAHSNNQYSGYNANSASSSHQRAYNSEHRSAVSGSAAESNTAANTNTYTHGIYNQGSSDNYNGVTGNLNNQVEDIGSNPKSYHSSYSYHKSWERQGDPYIIKPSTNGQYTMGDRLTSQRLTSDSNQGYSRYGSNNYHNRYQAHSGTNGEDCDENGHIRVARSYNSRNKQSQDIYEGQQSQNLEDFGQQSQNLDDFGQQSEDLGQQSQNLEDFGQQSQDLGQQSQDLSQQSQDLSQQSQDLGQQSQNLEDFGQQSQDLSQQSQDAGPPSQSRWDNKQQVQQTRLDNLNQQTHNQWDQLSQTDLGQQTQNTWSTLNNLQNGKYDKNHEEQIIQTHKPQETIFTSPETLNPQYGFYLNQHNQNAFNPTVLPSSSSSYGGSDYNQQYDGALENIGHHVTFNSMSNNNADANYYLHTSGSSNSYINTLHTNSYHPWTHNNNGYSSNNNYGSAHTSTSAGGSSLSSLWNKLDTIEKDTLSDKNETEISIANEDNKNSVQTNGGYETQTLNNGFYDLNNVNNKVYTPIYSSSSTEKNYKISNNTDILHTRESERGDIQPENIHRPQDVGRGDISSEVDDFMGESNSPFMPPETIELKTTSTTLKPSKDPEGIPALNSSKVTTPAIFHGFRDQSITAQDENTNPEGGVLSVLSLTEQKKQELENERLHEVINMASTTSRTAYSLKPHNFEDEQTQNRENNYSIVDQQSENFDPQRFHQFNEFGQQNENLDQQNVEHQVADLGEQNINIGQQNLDHQEVDFGQQHMNVDKPSIDHQVIDFGQQNMNLNQQSVGHQVVNIGHESINMNQQNVDHQVVDFSQQGMNINQQNVDHHAVDFGQQYNKEVDFGQQEQTQQESLAEFGQQQIEPDQAQKETQMQDWGQQNENLEMLEDLNQQVQTSQETQQIENFTPISTNHKAERQFKQLQEPLVQRQVVTQKTSNIETPPEPTTEKPGFWRRTKDKVSSWFSRS